MGVWTMNAQELSDQARDVAENGMLVLSGRLMMLLCGPAIIWLGTTIWTMNGEQVKVSARLDALVVQIQSQSGDIYRSGDAKRDFYARDQRDSAQDQRMDRFEVRVDRLENASRLTPH